MHEHGGGGGGFDSAGSSLGTGFDGGHHGGAHHGGGFDAGHHGGVHDASPARTGGRHRHSREPAGDLPGLSFPSWEQHLDIDSDPVRPASRGQRATAWAVAVVFIAFIAYVAWHIATGH